MDLYALGRILLSLLFVVAMILACAWLARKRLKPQGNATRTALTVTQRVSVGPRGMQVMVIEVEGERLVLGVTPGAINVLHTLAPHPPAPTTHAGYAEPKPLTFQRIFNNLSKRHA